MRVFRIAPALGAVTLCLFMAACSKPDVARPGVAKPGAGGPAEPTMTMSGAEKLRRLDIMLMVNSLRCRTTRDDFRSDYHRFTAKQMGTLNQAAGQLRSQLVARYGETEGKRAFDRLGTKMANAYGNGHKGMTCGQLKQVARNLGKVEGRATLVEAADQVLSRKGSARLAYGKR